MSTSSVERPGPPAEPSLDALIRQELAAMTIARSRLSNYANLPVGLLVLSLFWGVVPAGFLVGWLFAKVVVTVWRVVISLQFEQASVPRKIDLGRRFLLALAVDGLAWGALVPMTVGLPEHTLVVVAVAIVLGVAAVGFVVLSMSFRATLAFAIPAIFTALPFLLLHNDGVSRFLAAGLTIFLTMTLLEGRQSAKHAREMLRVRFQMDELARERQRALELAERASSAKGRFLSTMSHEIRTPLNGVLGMAELLQGTPLNPEQARYAEGINAAGRALHDLLSDILDLQKIEEDRVVLEQAPFDLPKLLAEVATGYRELAAARRNLLVSDVRAEGRVLGDPVRLRQVLVNLLGNANKFTEEGTITLRVRPANGPPEDPRRWYRITVEDTGIGIPSDVLPRLFQRFEQADASTTRRFGGSGLGLVICKHLVERMGGRIRVESEPGRGSRFWFDLPFEVAVAPEADTGRALVPPPGASVLVAEDNLINQQVVAALLEGMGAKVTVVGDGAQALAALATDTPYDLLLLDCQMPVMDGFEAAARIRALPPPRRDIPIVALTANAMAEDRQACLDAGMDDYIAKPVTGPRLGEVIARFVGAPRGDDRGTLPA